MLIERFFKKRTFALFVVCGKNPPSARMERVIRICAWAFGLGLLVTLIVVQFLSLRYEKSAFVDVQNSWTASVAANLGLVLLMR